MKKNIVIVIIVLTVMLLDACGNKKSFQGNIISNSTYYDMTFDRLNTSCEYDIFLNKGDSVEILLEKMHGKISAVIRLGDKEPIYQGNDMEASSFKVNITETGNYTILISGKNAKGHIFFSRHLESEN